MTTMCDEELKILKSLDTIGIILISAFAAALALLMTEILNWLNRLLPPEKNDNLKKKNEINFETNVTNNIEQLNFGYSYTDGPLKWKRKPPSLKSQMLSPINIDVMSATSVEVCDPLRWINYNKEPVMMFLLNNGLTVELDGMWSDGNEPMITGGALGNKWYIFKAAVFRCGVNFEEGSEHTVNFKRYPLEMQLEHSNIDDPEDLACVSYFYQISPEDNKSLNNVIQGLWKIDVPGLSASIYPKPLKKLVDTFSHGYYSYSGSLIHPPFSENVTWIIYPDPFCISFEQMELFHKMLDDNDSSIMKNSRPVQSANDSVIYYYSGANDQ